MMQQRQTYLDTVAGILIIYMIFMHCCQFIQITENSLFKVISVIFNCFMAWFFFKSGMFHKREQTIKKNLSKYSKKLLRPYIAFLIIGYIGYCISLYINKDTNWTHYLLTPIKEYVINGSISWALHAWFLFTLLIVKVLSPIFIEKINCGWIYCALIGCLTAWISMNCFTLQPYYIINFFPAMFFYGLGYTMRTKQFHIIIFALSIIVFSISIFYPSKVDFRTNQITSGSYLIWLLYASAGIIVFNNICKKLSYKIFPFTQIGEKSMYWFLTHWILLLLITNTIECIEIQLNNLSLLFFTFCLLIALLSILYPLIYYTKLNRYLGI